jgi:hypothetical protein
MWRWLRSLFGHETVEDVYAKRGIETEPTPRAVRGYATAQMVSGMNGVPLGPLSRRRRYEDEESMPTYSGNDLLTGIIIGEALSGSDSQPAEPAATQFEGFHGGESGGAGASGSWDTQSSDPTPSCDTSSSYDSSSSSDSGSSCSDSSSSSDSGSSGGSDF